MNIARIEDRLVVASEPTGLSIYDFDFDVNFATAHPATFRDGEPCVLRIGAIEDYLAEFAAKRTVGLRLINSPEEHRLASEIEAWYPKLAGITPRTQVFAELPAPEEIEALFGWPIFLKGSRQTSRHDPALSIIASPGQYLAAAEAYRSDPILRWQKPAVREFVPLEPVPGQVPGKIRPSLEFRSFWWHGKCVGWGRYWYQLGPYSAPDAEAGLAVAGTAARELAVPFLVVDFAKTIDGRWILIECNDAQESGYAAIQPRALWRRVLDLLAEGDDAGGRMPPPRS